MSKKRLGNDPFDDIDILKGPDDNGKNKTGKITSHKTSHLAGNMTSDFAIPKNNRLRNMIYIFREDQLKELGKLSKQTGRGLSELARTSFYLLIDVAQKND